MHTCRRHYPGRFNGPVRSYLSVVVGLPRISGGSAPASPVSGPAQRLLTLRPVRSPSRLRDPLHRRLQRLRHLGHCSDCYRVERTSSRAGVAPAVDQRLSRRTEKWRLSGGLAGPDYRIVQKAAASVNIDMVISNRRAFTQMWSDCVRTALSDGAAEAVARRFLL